MQSHSYDFRPSDLLRLLGLPLLPMAAVAAFMHGAAFFNILPGPRPALDLDRTIIIHKAEASGLKRDAEVLLLGDSSCLMDVSAVQLTAELGRPALNLGTLSYLDLDAHAALLRRFVAANPNQPTAVVLLLHPEALRRSASEPYHTEFFNHFLAGRDHVRKRNVSHWLGLELFRSRVLSRALPAPLPGGYGQLYGFTADLERHLTRHRGSAIDPDPAAFKGNPEYRLAASLEARSRAFRAAVPANVRLFVGITPLPAGFAPANYAEIHRRMSLELAGWLQAQPLATPAVMADDVFSKTSHLNEAGVKIYTSALAQALKPAP